MFKRLSVFLFFIAIALAYLFNKLEFLTSSDSILINSTEITPGNMAMASVSRSIVKKVLAVETPEVSSAFRIRDTPFKAL